MLAQRKWVKEKGRASPEASAAPLGGTSTLFKCNGLLTPQRTTHLQRVHGTEGFLVQSQPAVPRLFKVNLYSGLKKPGKIKEEGLLGPSSSSLSHPNPSFYLLGL